MLNIALKNLLHWYFGSSFENPSEIMKPTIGGGGSIAI